MPFLGWRQVPVCTRSIWGRRHGTVCPASGRRFVGKPPRMVARVSPLTGELYVVRRVFEQSSQETYVCSLSSRTIVYKGMFLVERAAAVLPGSAGRGL